MIPLRFTSPISDLLTYMREELPERGHADAVAKRQTPGTRPNKFLLLVGDGGPRLQEVHRLYRVRAQAWVTSANGTTDWDGVNEFAADAQYLMERFAKDSPLIATVTDSTGPDAVQDPSGVEYRFLSVEYQLRGTPAP